MTLKAEFSNLPRELRDLIWENLLPPPRLVILEGLRRLGPEHLSRPVQRIYKLWFQDQQVKYSERVDPRDITHCFNFSGRHAPPILTQICRESRQFAVDAGYFLLPAWNRSGDGSSSRDPLAGWFNEETDTLFINGSSSPLFLKTKPFRIPNAVRVRSVGLNWGHIGSDVSITPRMWRLHDERVGLWRKVLALYAYTPGLRTLLLVRPGFDHGSVYKRRIDEGGTPEPRLVPISLSTEMLPGYMRRMMPPGLLLEQAGIPLPGQKRVTWEDVVGAMRAALEDKEAKRWWDEGYEFGEVFPPEVVVCDVTWVKGESLLGLELF